MSFKLLRDLSVWAWTFFCSFDSSFDGVNLEAFTTNLLGGATNLKYKINVC